MNYTKRYLLPFYEKGNKLNMLKYTTTLANTLENILEKQLNIEVENLKDENNKLKEDLNGLPTGQASGEIINITDSANMRFSSFKISGNSVQDGIPTLDNPIEIKSCGDYENLLPNTFTSRIVEGATSTVNNDKSITFNGTAVRDTALEISHSIELDAGDYVLSLGKTTGSITKNLNLSIVANAIDFIADVDNNKKTQVFSLATKTNIGFSLYVQEMTVFNNYTIYPMIYKGTKEIPYTPYGQNNISFEICNENNLIKQTERKSQQYTIQTQRPMGKTEDYEDTFVKIDDIWNEEHYIDRYIFTGKEDWIVASISDTVKRFYINLNNINNLSINANKIIVKSNCFIGASYSNRANNNSIFSICDDKTSQVCINTDKITSTDLTTAKEEWKTYLAEQYEAGTPVYADFVLATPIDLECTETQIEVLDEIENNAKSYKDLTHISSTDEVSPNISVIYKKDIEKLFANTLIESGV